MSPHSEMDRPTHFRDREVQVIVNDAQAEVFGAHEEEPFIHHLDLSDFMPVVDCKYTFEMGRQPFTGRVLSVGHEDSNGQVILEMISIFEPYNFLPCQIKGQNGKLVPAKIECITRNGNIYHFLLRADLLEICPN